MNPGVAMLHHHHQASSSLRHTLTALALSLLALLLALFPTVVRSQAEQAPPVQGTTA